MTVRRIVLMMLVMWFALTGETTWSQRVTAVERESIKQAKGQIDAAGKLLKSKKLLASGIAYEAARERLALLAAGARPELAKAIKLEYERLEKTHKMLIDAGEELSPLPTLEEAVATDLTLISFQQSVAPIIVAKCGNCHVNQSRGRFSAATFDALQKSTTIAFGIPQDSRLIQVIESGEMPRGGLKIEANELEILKTWILQGAKFDADDRNQNLGQMVNGGATTATTLTPKKPTGKETVSFGLHIAPILIENCAQCHMVNNPRGNFNQATFENLLRGGDSGSPITSGNSLASSLYRRIAAGEMPPTGKLPPQTIDLIKTWIDEGAAYDGADANSTLVSLASLAKAEAQTHTELMEDRKTLSLKQWHLVMDKTPLQTESKHFRVIGSSDDARVAAIAELLEKVTPKLSSYFQYKSESPLVKGNISVFVFDKRYDFSEFGKMVIRRDFPKHQLGHWDFTVTDAFVSILLTQNQSASDAEIYLTQQVSALYIASLAPDVPRWFADGAGYWAAARLLPKQDQVKAWEVASLEAAQTVKSPNDFLDNRLSDHDAGLVGYRFVKALKKRSSSFDRLIEQMRAGESFEKSFQNAYGATPQAYLSGAG